MNDLELATLAATRAGDIIRDMYGKGVATELKGSVDPVTIADTKAEAAILELLSEHRPDDGVLAEESGASGGNDRRRWVIDPLDGTVNFVHEVPHVAVSIGLWEGNRAVVGVIVDVLRRDVYSAAAGEGAFLNGTSIHTSQRTELSEMLVATGFPYDRDTMGGVYTDWIAGVLPHVRGLRRVGSAALDFAYVATGRYDAYFEHGIAPWDCAAGMLLVEEAGGATVDLDGAPATLHSADHIATSGAGHSVLTGLIAGAAPAELRGR